MAECIEREVAVKNVMAAKWIEGYDGAMAMEIVAAAPAVDVAPVVHARWEPCFDKNCRCRWGFGKCSNCGQEYYAHAIDHYKYCPICGAKMDGAITEIAKILNVDKSTVSRTLNRAHQRIRDLAQFEEQYYEPDCDSEDSSEMDFADPETAKKLLGCLTERQAVYMYLYYGEWLTMEDIGKLLSVDKSTICRTLERAAIRIQGCFPATAQCGVLDLGAIGDVLWTLYQQQEIKSLVPEYAQEAARRANTMQLQRCDAAGISPAVHDHYPEQSLWPSFEMEPCEENAAASLQYVPPLIQFPSKTRFYARLWRTPFHGLVGQSRLLSALLEESRQSQVKHRSAYIYTRLCSLVSGFCNKVSRKIVSKLYRLKSKIAS